MNSEEIKKTLELHKSKDQRIDELAMLKIQALNNIAEAIKELARSVRMTDAEKRWK